MFRILTALALAAGISSAASAQETTAPDGTEAFGIEPYVGVLGGYHSFDRDSEFGTVPGRSRFDGAVISGIAGVNVPLGPVVIGAEGNVGKGFGDIDWEYGVAGRAGRSEEHTSELQSLMRISYAVFCLKKKNIQKDK